MLRKVKIYSVVPLSDLSPACPLRILWSIPMQMRSITILPNILLTIYRRVIPRHFLHSLDFPFFGILLMTLLIHLSGTFFRLQIMSISSFTLSVVNSRSAFSSSTVIISLPGDLPFLRLFIVLLISALLTGPVFMPVMPCSSQSPLLIR